LSPLEISDERWFQAIADPESGGGLLPFPLPSFPPDPIQRGYNGRTGLANLEEAFSFYRYLRPLLPANGQVMDFGAGWGRIARFFLRDTAPANIWAVDPMPRAVTWMRKTGLPCTIVSSQPQPPIPGVAEARFDLIYAHSVFSHLAERQLLAWLPYLVSLLEPRGVLVLTTRGRNFIAGLEQRNARGGWRKRRAYGNLARLRRRYEAGEFIFVQDRTGGLQPPDFGQAFVPEGYLRRAFPGLQIQFSEDVPGVAQAVIAVRRGA
jgi:hypothetical protein